MVSVDLFDWWVIPQELVADEEVHSANSRGIVCAGYAELRPDG